MEWFQAKCIIRNLVHVHVAGSEIGYHACIGMSLGLELLDAYFFWILELNTWINLNGAKEIEY